MLEVTNLRLSISRQLLSFTLVPGQILWVKGENGAGKSTLLKTLLGFIPPEQGEITWQCERPAIFYLAHDLGLQPALTVLEYCCWHPAIVDLPSIQACQSALKMMNLLPQANQLCGQLSRGQQQRLLMACAVLSRAPLWLLDEPLTALDLESRQRVLDCLLHHKATGGAAVVISHYPIPQIADEVLDVLV